MCNIFMYNIEMSYLSESLQRSAPVVMPQRSVSRMQTRTQMQTMTSFPDYKIPGINKVRVKLLKMEVPNQTKIFAKDEKKYKLKKGKKL